MVDNEAKQLTPQLAWLERVKIYAKVSEIYERNDALYAEAEKLRAECGLMCGKAELLFADAVIHCWGGKTKMEWKPNGDCLVMNELFQFDNLI